jgi:RNA polymerase sigma-70 factor (ECF subfamily)
LPEPELRLVPPEGPADIDDLMRKVARGDSGAFEELYDELAPAVFGLARRVVRDPAKAEDVTQEVFVDVWRKATRFDVDRGTPDEVSHDEPGDALIQAEEHGAVRDCLGTLTDLQLESVRLAYFNGYTYGEVATLLDKPLPTIKTRMRDGLIRLRDCLEGAR